MKINLTEAKIKRLSPQANDQTIWDQTTSHLGIRIRANGAKRYIHMAMRDCKLTKTTLGDAAVIPLAKARAMASRLNNGVIDKPPQPVLRFTAFVTEEWWPKCTAHHKPKTKSRHHLALDQHLLPAFGDMPIDAITKAHILDWFERYSRQFSGGANRVMDVLNSILNHGVRLGVLPRNPAKGIRPNPKRKMTRFLSRDEQTRLLAALKTVPEHFQTHAEIIRMLLFTGCRKGEILTLKWQDVAGHDEKGATLALSDSKTGARTIWLGDEARAVLTRQEDLQSQSSLASDYVFPHPHGGNRPLASVDGFWHGLRKEIGLGDVRLHDLRHTFASKAVRQGIPLPVLSKLLGHSTLAMTMRYTHLTTADIEAAAERVGARIK